MSPIIDMLFHLAVIIVAFWTLLKGYKRGFMRQVPSCIGICFGILCAYIFRFPFENFISSFLHISPDRTDYLFVVSNISCALIYLFTSALFRICTYPLKFVLNVFETGILNNIAGALLYLFKGLLLISLFLNILLCMHPSSRLLYYARSDDGDIVHETMLLAPWLIGSENIDTLVHKYQLEDAKKIS